MNRLRGSRSLLFQILHRYHYQPTSRCSSVRGFSSLPLFRPAVRPSVSPPPLHGKYGTTSRRSFVPRWYHDPRKVVAATAITLSATVMAVCSRYDRQIVPCTNRSHLVVCSLQEERDLGDSQFAAELAPKFVILDPSDPRSIRVRIVAQRILHAAHRGLGIYDSNDAPMLRVTQKWGMPRAPQPHTSHLREINWEVFVAKNDAPGIAIVPSGKILISTGLLDLFKTDDELAFALAHEVGHVIARHAAEISHWLPMFLNRISARRMEIESDHIGTLLLGAAGFHPQRALVALLKLANEFDGASLLEHILSDFPKTEKRVRLLSEGKAMKEALELYREVTAMDKVTNQYFPDHVKT